MPGKKKQASLDIFLKVESMKLEYELAFTATSTGKVSGLMIRMHPRKVRSLTQVLGIKSRAWRVRCSASSGMRDCIGKRWTP